MNTGTDILEGYTDHRLAALEASDIARRISSEAGILRKAMDTVVARVENRVIETVLMSRLRKALRTSNNLDAAHTLIDTVRAAYHDGSMETLPNFLPVRNFSMAEPIAGEQENPLPGLANRPLILYIPGGGFILPPSKRQKSMIQRLSQATSCEITMGTHRLAPEHPFPAAPQDIAAKYARMLETGIPASNIFLAADTAGASVGLGAIQLLKDAGEELPAGIILFSPWCDLSLSGWSYITRSMTSQSPFRMETAAFCARLYLKEIPATNPLASAIFADLKGWPPILIHTSENDLHFDDAIRLAEKGRDCGCTVTVNYWDSPRHHLERLSSKDAERSFKKVKTFINDKCGSRAA